MSQSHVLKHSHPPFVRCDDAPLVESEKSETVAGTEDVGTEDGSIGDGSVEDEGIEDNGIGDKDTEDEGRESLSGIDDESIEEEDVSPSALEEELENAEVDPCYDYDLDPGTAFTAEQAIALRRDLRDVGPNRFIELMTREEISMRKMVTIFGIRPDLPYSESWYCQVLGHAMKRELRKRYKLPEYNTIDDAVSLLQKSKNIMVITGAGISTSLGIPDFRSKNTGFYSQLLARGFTSPEDVFDIHNFDHDPSQFYYLAKDILPVTNMFSPTHAFIKLLQDKGKLLTNYTQNIDNIEAVTGISRDRLIQCHGSWATASCRKCLHTVPGEEIFEDVMSQRVSICKQCVDALKQKPPKRKRASNGPSKHRKSTYSDSEDDGQYDIPQPGVMKPNITFFGEKLPNTFFDRLTKHDVDKVDLVVIIGTSMKVAPVSEIPHYLSASIPQIYISREPVDHINFDITLLGESDNVVAELCARAAWELNHEMVPQDFKAVSKPCDGRPDTWSILRI